MKDGGTKLTTTKLQVINWQSKTIQNDNNLSENVTHTFNDQRRLRTSSQISTMTAVITRDKVGRH
jgi:hypothetical protein